MADTDLRKKGENEGKIIDNVEFGIMTRTSLVGLRANSAGLERVV